MIFCTVLGFVSLEITNGRNGSLNGHPESSNAVAKRVVQYDEKEDKYGMSYNELICPLIKSVQELTAENNQLKSQLASVMSRLDALENK